MMSYCAQCFSGYEASLQAVWTGKQILYTYLHVYTIMHTVQLADTCMVKNKLFLILILHNQHFKSFKGTVTITNPFIR